MAIFDYMGLQSDGTGIIGDQLRLSFGSTFGTPTAITWYRNGSVEATLGNGVNMNADGGLWLNVTADRGVGLYKATVVVDGVTYETNEIEITDKEEAATIVSFTLEDDYTDGTDIHYDTTDQRAVATVTLNKAYAGQLIIYKASDTKYANPINVNDRLTTSTGVAAVTAAQAIDVAAVGAGGVADARTIMTSNQATNYQVLNTVTAAFGRGYGFINPDGTATYKWVLDDGGVLRGTDYVVCFNQNSISTDTPGTGIANVSDETTAPYVKAPAAIAVTKVANGSKPEVTFLDEDDAEITWLGYETTATQADLSGGAAADQNGMAVSTRSQLETIGLTDAQIYGSTNKTNDPTASGVSVLVTGVTNRVTGAADTLVKGVWTTPNGVTAGNAAYWFAKATLKKGIFGAEKIELVSEPADSAQDAATDIDLVESKTAATTAVVKFSNLRTDGTVYIVQGDFQGTAADTGVAHETRIVTNDTTVAAIFNKFDESDPNTYTAKVAVEAGTASIDVPNAISSNLTKVAGAAGANLAAGDLVNGNIVDANANGLSTDDTWALTADVFGNDHYIAVFIPDDQVNYGMVYTDGAFSTDSYTSAGNAKSGLIVTQVATTVDKTDATYTLATGTAPAAGAIGTVVINAGAIQVKDQFGTAMVYGAVNNSLEVDASVSKLIATMTEDASGTCSVSTRGVVTLTLNMHSSDTNAANTYIDKGETFTYKVAGLNDLTIAITTKHAIEATTAGLDYDAADAADAAEQAAAGGGIATCTTSVAAGQTMASDPATLKNAISVS